jgi:Flp pilus assembly protein TadG
VLREQRYHRRSLPNRDRGSVSLEIAILGPVLLLLILSIVQAGLWFYARSLALAAAQEGVAAARSYQAHPASGISRAQSFLDEQAGDSLTDTTVSSAGSTPTRIRIEVTGRALSVLPGIPGLQVTQGAEGPVERFTTESAP